MACSSFQLRDFDFGFVEGYHHTTIPTRRQLALTTTTPQLSVFCEWRIMGAGASASNSMRTEFPLSVALAGGANLSESHNPQICWFCDEPHLGPIIFSDRSYPPLSCCKKCLTNIDASNSTFCSTSSGKNSVFQPSARLRNIYQYITSAQAKLTENDCNKIVCGVCQNDLSLKDDRCRLMCGHIFHECCIGLWFEHYTTCPTCRHSVKNCRERKCVEELVAENSEEQLCEKVLALQYLAASVSEIGNIDSGDIFMSHLMCKNDESTKRELANKFHSLSTPKANSIERNNFFLQII